MNKTTNTSRNNGLVLTSLREQQAEENERLLWRAFYRTAMKNATCTSCTCQCKKQRKGCGNFTPSAKFTTAARQRYQDGRKA